MNFKTTGTDCAFGFAGPDNLSLGLTKREWFAAQALIGLIANDEAHGLSGHGADAVTLADDLIAELNKEK